MRIFWRTLKWFGLAFGAAVVLGALYIRGSEVYLYLTQSEEKAQAAASAMFIKICGRQGLDPRSFHGPDRPSIPSDKKLDSYTFVWTRPPKETITVSVTYLPYDLPYSISEGITESEQNAKTHP